MQRDIRATTEFRSTHNFYSALMAPGTGHIYTATEAVPAPNGDIYIAGLSFTDSLEAGPSSCIGLLSATSIKPVADAKAKLPRPSPDGRTFACAETRAAGDALTLRADGSAAPTIIEVDGHIEALEWSPDGARLLMVVAGLGSDVSGHEGGFATEQMHEGPDWLPDFETGQEENLWRRLWIHDLGNANTQAISASGTNVWEATWCGSDRIAVVRSSDHSESAWYTATLALIGLDGSETPLYTPTDQIGLPAGAPDGEAIAFVEAFCSDRGVVCGTLKLVTRDGQVRTLDTAGVEVTSVCWRNNASLHYAGHRAFETVAADCNRSDGRIRELWVSETETAGEWYPATKPVGADQFLAVVEAYAMPPRLELLGPSGRKILYDFASAGAREWAEKCGTIEPIRWTAPDGLEIHGWFVRPPDAKPPFPMMMDIHGGPVWANRNRWMGRLRATPLLTQRGCAVLYPNPRGSSTRGQDFARRVKGDMGGNDALDLLAACDALAAQGLIDRKAIALTGTSYGGFMSAMLVTKDPTIAAACPISPVSDWYSQHRTSQIGFFDEMFLEASAYAPGNAYFTRSPVMFAAGVKTPTLVMAGARDKNTPPGQALEFHRSLLEHGVETALATYPKDGHSLRGYPAFIDTAARILMWLGRYLPR